MRWDEIVVPLMFIALAAAAATVVFADDPEPTMLNECYGSLWTDCNQHKHISIPPAADSISNSVLVDYHPASFSNYLHDGGPPACLFTAQRHGNNLINIGGGRNCNHPDNGGRCGAFSEGFSVFGISGISCESAGVPLCSSGICY